mmetsp:Transcript_12509/g.12598  ORF Transcript_12509/g.12598 Transcript_12509/m.12598 type:complete len:375 (-) Transcript_12509:117-1241(-)
MVKTLIILSEDDTCSDFELNPTNRQYDECNETGAFEKDDIDHCDNSNDEVHDVRDGEETNRLGTSLISQTQHQTQQQQQGLDTLSVLSRVKFELSREYTFFSLHDLNHTPGANTEEQECCVINVQKSFAPTGIFVVLFRCAWLAVTIVDIALDHTLLHLKYLTELTLTLTLTYQILGLFLSLSASFDCLKTTRFSAANLCYQPVETNMGEICEPGIIVRIVWFLYGLCVVADPVCSSGYWAFVYEGDAISFDDLYKHLFIGFIVLFDGNVVGRIPVRCKHVSLFVTVGICYMLYTVYYSYFHLNGDGVLYSSLNWRNDFYSAIVNASIFVISGPLAFSFCWMCSSWSRWCTFDCRRRFYHGEVSYEELGGGEII